MQRCNRKTKFMRRSGTHIYISILLLVITAAAGVCHGQAKTGSPKRIVSQLHKEPVQKKELVNYTIVGKDTVYIDDLPAAKVFARMPKQKGRKWRQYYRLVHNFSKAYPYALVAKKIVMQADSTIETENMKWIKKGRYVDNVQDELFEAFEKPLRKMTISQGMLLMKLIDREVGKSSYTIIKEFKNGLTAGFWQGVARLFGSDLKKPYDPEGEDANVEELVRLLSPFECRVNLIRFHDIPDTPYQGASEEKMTWMRDYLTQHGVTTTIRASRGQDIWAACGLLNTKNKQA